MELIQGLVSCWRSNDRILVLGDFNLPQVCWSFDQKHGYFIPSSYPYIFIDFFNATCRLTLVQVNGVFNINSRLMELKFCNDNNFKVSRVNHFILPEDIYQPILYFAVSDTLSYSTRRYKYLFSKSNNDILKHVILDIMKLRSVRNSSSIANYILYSKAICESNSLKKKLTPAHNTKGIILKNIFCMKSTRKFEVKTFIYWK